MNRFQIWRVSSFLPLDSFQKTKRSPPKQRVWPGEPPLCPCSLSSAVTAVGPTRCCCAQHADAFVHLDSLFSSPAQVIQDKKSSNKFACAICCEKQSVRRILHSSPAAKDCRVVCQVSGVVAHACPECRAPGYLLTQGAGATLGASSQQSLNMVSAPSEGRRAVQRCASRADRTCTAGARAPRVRQARLWHRRWRRGGWVLRGRVRRASSTRSACSAARAQPMESVRGGARRTRGSIRLHARVRVLPEQAFHTTHTRLQSLCIRQEESKTTRAL